ncbi:ABC transporter permease [Streptantibioticus parmotrematis]|uniref:ABC transporter permease n=1 Tax=Streptantibioticus parmotrematis TaxID=2873249 RepID=UPI0033ED5CE8
MSRRTPGPVLRRTAVTVTAAARLQWALIRRSPGDVQVLVTIPLLAIVFLAMADPSQHPQTAARAALAPPLIGLWSMALVVAGEMISQDRAWGTLEPVIAAPAGLVLVVFGRIAAVVVTGLAAFAETWLVAKVLFGLTITVAHPGWFALTLAASVVAMAGTASVMSAVFVLARSARTYQNTLSYPFYLLGGVVLPASQLPEWLRPLTRVVFLSWASDLLRDSLRDAPVPDAWQRVAVILGLGLIGSAAGAWLLHRVTIRVRRLGTLGRA